MIIGIPREILEGENRVAALPETVREYRAMGFRVLVERSAGEGALRSDEEYAAAGAEISGDAGQLYAACDIILKVKQPTLHPAFGRHEVELIREGSLLVTFLHPAAPANHAMVLRLRDRNITSLTMDSIPRISRAQTMDALTSMSTVTGYKSVLIAANHFPRFVPTLGTAIGMIKAARFLIVGAGVVGLQAIATAKRLGGAVSALDISEAARKAAESLGAKVAGFEVPAELAAGPDGYARALPAGWLEKERQALAPLLREADIVILSALVPGEVAPALVTKEMVESMKPGSVIMDISIDQGGNCEMTPPGSEATHKGVYLCGIWNIPGSLPVHASWLYAQNLMYFVKNLFKKGAGAPDLSDEIVRSALVTHQGRILHHGTLKALEMAGEALPEAIRG
ncbi:MAG: NAD(P) transhydrogenase subunit alpha [Bryobacterales bacterium]|nr:NAD(P) transhydrogenase subunit alpha [Bryobacterales bacterium]